MFKARIIASCDSKLEKWKGIRSSKSRLSFEKHSIYLRCDEKKNFRY